MLKTNDLDYVLPPELIATQPLPNRDDARLMVIRRSDPTVIEHHQVRSLPQLLQPEDLLVVNDTRVLPARFFGQRVDSGGRIEGIYLDDNSENLWTVLLRSNGKLKSGMKIRIMRSPSDDPDEIPEDDGSALIFELVERKNEQWLIRSETDEAAWSILNRLGWTPLPPYIVKQRKTRDDAAQIADGEDRDWYQTVYAGPEWGAVAAPTAGLHFTEALLFECEAANIGRAYVTLHVGAGTFKPVDTEHVEEHPIHSERFRVPQITLQKIRETRAAGGRVVAVGTTTVRALESMANHTDLTDDAWLSTELLITPGYAFQNTDILMTNFHLPKSTLMALVGALIGIDNLKAAYDEAIQQRYRFYSYGDAMLILP